MFSTWLCRQSVRSVHSSVSVTKCISLRHSASLALAEVQLEGHSVELAHIPPTKRLLTVSE